VSYKNITIIILLFYIILYAQDDISFSVTADKTNVTLGEQIQITAQLVSNKKLKDLSMPQIPKNEDFDVLHSSQNQSQSTSIQIINGSMSQTVNITYYFQYSIMPKKIGSFTFPSLKINVEGKEYVSSPFQINVTKEPSQTSDVRISLIPNKKNLYLGEQAILTVKVSQKAQASVQLTQQGLASLYENLEKNLSKNFAIARLFNQLPSKGVMETVNGEREFSVSVQYSLFPLSSGEIRIPPMPLEYIGLKRIQTRRSYDFFDDFFSTDFFGPAVQQIPKTAISNGLILNVQTLPPSSKQFSGAVGTFSLKVTAAPLQVPAGEAVTFTINIRGNTRAGNIPDISLPQLTDCDILAPEKQISHDTTSKGIYCSKTLKYPIIPKQQGNLVIPSLSFTYFDPILGQYKTISSDSILITVTQGKATLQPSATSRYLTQEEIRQIGRDIRYIKSDIQIKNQTFKIYKSPLFFILYSLPFLIFISSLLYKLNSLKYKKDSSLILKQKALANAQKNLSILKKRAKSIPKEEFLSKIYNCIEDFITNKFGFSASGKTIDALKEELINKGLNQKIVDNLISFIESLDTYRFGGQNLESASIKEIIEKTEKIIKDIAKQKKGNSR